MLRGEYDKISRIISAIGSIDFGPTLDEYLQSKVNFDMSCVLIFSSDRKPTLLHDGYHKSVPRRVLSAYMHGGYLLDPFYVACCNHHPAGLWRMSQLAPDSFSSSGFMISPDIHPCVSSESGSLVEEVGFIFPLSSRVSAVYSLMRNMSHQQFADQELEKLRTFEPMLSAAISVHYQATSATQPAPAESQAGEADAEFQDIFGGKLTEAQRTIAKLILRGHSTVSIAQNLGISEGTAKIHRHNIYKRLNITSQAELFSIFIEHLSKA